MLLQLLIHQPQAVVTIVQKTPVWVWGLASGLAWLGLSQVRDRRTALARVAVMPVAMLGFAVWGMVSAFGSTQLAEVLGLWLASASAMFALVTALTPGSGGARYDAASRRFDVPGSWVPLALILGIFLFKYGVGVELAMQPQLARDTAFALPIAAIYGAFNGLFAARAARLLRLVGRPRAAAVAAL